MSLYDIIKHKWWMIFTLLVKTECLMSCSDVYRIKSYGYNNVS